MRRAAVGALKSRLSKRKLQTEQATQEKAGERKCSQLEEDFLVCEGLKDFCQGFSKSIEQLLPLLQEFWQIVQSLDQEWFAEDNGLLDTHIWALRMGLTSTAPKVHQQLQVSLKSCSRVAKKFQELEEAMQVRNTAWVEKEHYKRKLHEMREEMHKQDQSGRHISLEQLEILARNEEKHQKAQDCYESFQTTARAAADARSELKSALRDAVRTVTCGWFISTGAGVCSAVNRAETMAGKASQATGAAPASAQQALPSSAPTDTVPSFGSSTSTVAAALPARAEDVERSDSEEFDPTNPFKAAWTCEELVGDGLSESAAEELSREPSRSFAAEEAGGATTPAQSSVFGSGLSGASSSGQPGGGTASPYLGTWPGGGAGHPLEALSMDELTEMLQAAGLRRPDARGGEAAARREMQALLLKSQVHSFEPHSRQ